MGMHCGKEGNCQCSIMQAMCQQTDDFVFKKWVNGLSMLNSLFSWFYCLVEISKEVIEESCIQTCRQRSLWAIHKTFITLVTGTIHALLFRHRYKHITFYTVKYYCKNKTHSHSKQCLCWPLHFILHCLLQRHYKSTIDFTQVTTFCKSIILWKMILLFLMTRTPSYRSIYCFVFVSACRIHKV